VLFFQLGMLDAFSKALKAADVDYRVVIVKNCCADLEADVQEKKIGGGKLLCPP